jgi:hypothetical protein
MTIDLPAARTFIDAEARVLEQRVTQALFDGGDADAVVRAVAAYRNDDGGFGHGLEPDKRAPASQPLDVEVALERLASVGAPPSELALAACDYLASVAEEGGAVPIAFASILEHPHAEHWAQIPLVAGLNPTASIAAYGHALGVQHPWVDQATEWCFRSLEHEGPPGEVHALRCVTRLLEHAPDRARAEACASAVAAALPNAPMYQERPKPDEYGLSPLEFATTPTSCARPWFTDDVIETNLDHLEDLQQADGGWPIAWEPPSMAARCDWRGIVTLHALQVLAAYGRLP